MSARGSRGPVRRRLPSSLLAAVLLVGGTTACEKAGGSRAEPLAQPGTAHHMTPATAVAKAASTSARIKTLHYRISATLPKPGHIEAEASMDTHPLVMTMSMKVTSPTLEPGRNQVEIRFVDGSMFVGGNGVLSQKAGGKHWLSAAPAVWGRGNADNMSYGMLPNQLEQSPLSQSQLLLASHDLRDLGAESVDGTKTTHYRGTVTFDSLRTAVQKAPDKATKEQWVDRFDQFMALELTDKLTMDQWIAGDGSTRRFRMRGTVYAKPGTDDRKPMDLTVTFMDIDRPVTVKAPSADDTAQLGNNHGG